VFSILFEDDHIIAVNKPEGIASIPERAPGKESLLSLLSPRFPGKLYVVHRLDKEVSGVILFAKNAQAHKYLNDQFSSRNVFKTYLALVHGIIEEDQGLIEKPIRQFGSGRMAVDPIRGKASATSFEVTERFGSHTLVRVHPQTGRRHQIRVHFYSLGHPIAGDPGYGEKAIQRLYPRLMLHAQEIRFRLPGGREIMVEAALPESFQMVVNMVRKGCSDAAKRRSWR
jgi:tRNA pseudouridine32 synthase/23S rRNA pseudouridine746 synthase